MSLAIVASVRKFLVLFTLALGCSDNSEPDTAQLSSSATGPEETSTSVDMEWLDRVKGSWLGPVDPTPFGPIPEFPLDFAWEADGSLHARTENPAGGHFDFRFHLQDGVWLLTEEGELPHGVVQRWTLEPVERVDDRVRFAVTEMPGFLEMDVTVNDESLVMTVRLGGQPHVVFSLRRTDAGPEE